MKAVSRNRDDENKKSKFAARKGRKKGACVCVCQSCHAHAHPLSTRTRPFRFPTLKSDIDSRVNIIIVKILLDDPVQKF